MNTGLTVCIYIHSGSDYYCKCYYLGACCRNESKHTFHELSYITYKNIKHLKQLNFFQIIQILLKSILQLFAKFTNSRSLSKLQEMVLLYLSPKKLQLIVQVTISSLRTKISSVQAIHLIHLCLQAVHLMANKMIENFSVPLKKVPTTNKYRTLRYT